jgi:3-phytase
VPDSSDASDDPAIWVNPDDPTKSFVVGTNKRGGLALYNLDGRMVQYVASGEFNNVDLRTVRFGGEPIVLVAANERSKDAVVLFRLDPAAERLERLRRFAIGVRPSGLCLYLDEAGECHLFVCGENVTQRERDQLEHWKLVPDPDKTVAAELVATVPFSSECEGMVVDDATAELYVAEEAVGIWKLDARDIAKERRLILKAHPDGPLHGDVEGLAVMKRTGDPGYLLASSQGSDDFVVLRRAADYAVAGRFEIVGGRGIDGVTHTDGIDVTTAAMGDRYPRGLFVVQDDVNETRQNFKLISVEEIESALGL